MEDNGLFFVIEGTKGSDKNDQFKLLSDRLTKAGHDVALFTFPQYTQPSSYFAKQYLSGNYGSAQDVGPYTGSLFFALDRYEAAKQIRQAMIEGKIVLVNRFTGSNMAHQGAKFINQEERRGFFIWLENLEYIMLNIPRPTKSLILRVPPEVAVNFADSRLPNPVLIDGLNDSEPKLIQYQRAAAVYDDICSLFPKDFQRIDCVRSGKLLEPTKINDLIWETILPLLPEVNSEQIGSIANYSRENTEPSISNQDKETINTIANDLTTVEVNSLEIGKLKNHEEDYSITGFNEIDFAQRNSKGMYKYDLPRNLDTVTAETYTTAMDKIFDKYIEIATKLNEYLQTISENKVRSSLHIKARSIALSTLPVASLAEAHPSVSNKSSVLSKNRPVVNSRFKEIVNSILPGNYGQQEQPIRLASVSPRNEFDILPSIIYEKSYLSLDEIQSEYESWDYSQKSKIYESYLNNKEANFKALESIEYEYDILSEYFVYQELLQNKNIRNINLQPLTPRYGFSIPKIIEEAGLADVYEDCFDISLGLNSQLVVAGYEYESQLATLFGHKARFHLKLTAIQAIQLLSAGPKEFESSGYRLLLNTIYENVAQHHPILAETIKIKK